MLDAESYALVGLEDYYNNPIFSGFDGSDSSQNYAIAILDSGADMGHEVFGPDVSPADDVPDRIVYQYDYVDDDSNAQDGDHLVGSPGHGTQVAGIIAEMVPGADLIILRVLNWDLSANYEFIQDALEWVYNNRTTYNIVAVNMSFGDFANYTSDQTGKELSGILGQLAGANVACIAAAGNNFAVYNHTDDLTPEPGVSYPAADASVITVGATWVDEWEGQDEYVFPGNPSAIDYTQATDRVAAFSQRHSSLLEVFAPGASLETAYSGGGTIIDQVGTNLSAAHVTAAVALAQQLNDEFGYITGRLSKSQLVTLLKDTGVQIHDGDNETDNVTNTQANYKRLNIEAMAYKLFKPATAPDLVAGSDWGFSDTDNKTGDTTPTFTGTAPPNSHVWLYFGSTAVANGQADSNGVYTLTPSAQTLSGSWTVTVRVAENSNVAEANRSQPSPALTVTHTESKSLSVNDTFVAKMNDLLSFSGKNETSTSTLEIKWTTTPISVKKTGSGAVIIPDPLNQTVSISNRTVPVTYNADAGTSTFNIDTGIAGVGQTSRVANWTVNADATVNFTTTQNLAALNIEDGGNVSITAATGTISNPIVHKVLFVGSFSLHSSGKLDMTNNGMVIDFASVAEALEYETDPLREWLIDGRGGTGLGKTWGDSTGIMSSTAHYRNTQISANSRSIGYVVNAYPHSPTGTLSTFLGQTVDASSILLRYTVTADFDLDGTVENDDATILGAEWAPGSLEPHWAKGDADYNGFVDNDDVTLLNAFWQHALETS